MTPPSPLCVGCKKGRQRLVAADPFVESGCVAEAGEVLFDLWLFAEAGCARARVAVARKLLTVCWSVLRNRRSYFNPIGAQA